MNEIILLIYPLLLFAFTFYRAKISKKGEFSPCFLDADQTKSIQVFACIAIMIHHVTQQVTVYGSHNLGPITLFNYIGFLFTSVFFFFSGFGLITSIYRKNNYLDLFLCKRLSSVLIPFWITNFIIILYEILVLHKTKDFVSLVKEISGIVLINSNGWFVIEIIILYLAFFLLFSLLKNRDIALFLLAVASVCLISFSLLQGHDPENGKVHWFRGEWWYNSTICFIYGAFFARFRDKIESFMRNKYKGLLLVISIALIMLVFGSVYANDHFGYYLESRPLGTIYALITLIVQSCTCLVFMTFVMLLNMKISIHNKGLSFIGKFTLSIFLIHGYLVNVVLVEKGMTYLQRFFIVIISSIICGIIIGIPINFLVKKVREKSFCIRLPRIISFEKKNFNTGKKKIVYILGVIVFTGVIVFIVRGVLQNKEYISEVNAINNAEVGDTVLFGRYDTQKSHIGKERMTWVVVYKENDRVCLLSEYGIAGSWYNQRHVEISWEECDLRKLLNSNKFTNIFSKKEKELIVPLDGDIISLLSSAQALEIFDNDKERELAITDMAIYNGVNINTPSKANNWDMKGYRSSWWWLRGEAGIKSLTAPIVTEDGEIILDEKTVNKPGGAIRPVVWVEIE
nr:acyltransferase family protein [uncultured Butyrivibrio sp.]